MLHPDNQKEQSLLGSGCGTEKGTFINHRVVCTFLQGYNVTIGPGCYINFNCCFLDCAKITIGRNVRESSSHPLCSSTNDLKARCVVLQVLIVDPAKAKAL